MVRTILIFGGLSVAILILYQLSRLSIINYPSNTDVLVIVSALSFILIGWLLNRLIYIRTKKRTVTYKKSILSKQELKVLVLIADGLSNQQIAEELYIAESTVKIHVSKILNKLDASRRTEAVRIARDLEII